MKTHFLFFSGKGGVGKSSIAAATALHYAENGEKTLLISTDPAGNLGDIFQQTISIDRISVLPNLDVIQLDADKITDAYKQKLLAPLEEILDGLALEAVKEQFNGGCTVEIAVFDRFSDFLSETLYDCIIFDTAPTGHTLRLMSLPGEWNDYIAKSAQGSGQTCIGPVSQIQEAKAKYQHAVDVMQDGASTTVGLVCRPEKTSVYELQRAKAELEATGIHQFSIYVNGVIPDNVTPDSLYFDLRQKQQNVLNAFAENLKDVTQIPLQSTEINGIENVRQFARVIFDGGRSLPEFSKQIPVFEGFSPASDLKKLLEKESEKRVLVFTGKGGVGKTVAACAMAEEVAEKGRTLLITTDPAAHIGQVFETEIGYTPVEIGKNLWAANIDQREAGKEYKAAVLADAKKQHYSDSLLASLKEELDSPCTEEIAVFEKFAQHVTNPEWDFVVIDTAPTGHTLRLLELPFDYQEQLGVKKDATPDSDQRKRINLVVNMLKDPRITHCFLVAYPEYTPLHESERAAADLARVGITISGVMLNLILPATEIRDAFSKSRFLMQQHYLAIAKKLFSAPLFAMPYLKGEISSRTGISALRRGFSLHPDLSGLKAAKYGR